MAKKPKTSDALSAVETVTLLDSMAARLRAGDRSFEMQMPLNQLTRALLLLQHREGALLVNRIAFQLLTAEMAHERYDVVQRHAAALGPLDPDAAAAALETLAEELRDRNERPSASVGDKQECPAWPLPRGTGYGLSAFRTCETRRISERITRYSAVTCSSGLNRGSRGSSGPITREAAWRRS